MNSATLNNNKISLIPTKKPFLNNSLALANKLNKSRSILKNSVLRCALKENNSDLARSLANKESELLELRKENLRLLHENYDMTHSGQYRHYNLQSYMVRFSELSEIALSLFTNVCKLSDELLEMKNHPFLIGDYLGNENDNTRNECSIPAPFLSKDKIPRSPLCSHEEINEFNSESNLNTNTDKVDYLVSRIAKIKNQSNHSIHNISMTFDGNVTLSHRPNKPDVSQHTIKVPASIIKQKSPEISVPIQMSSHDGLIKEIKEVKMVSKKKVPRKRKSSKYDDPIVLSGTTAKPRKKNLKLKTNIKESNKEEYKKHKENDAYHLSINETINTTVLPPSLNEFKNQQKPPELVNTVKEIDALKDFMKIKEDENVKETQNVLKKIETKQQSLVRTENNIKPIIFLNNDDDDFLLSKNNKVKKRNFLGDSTLEMIDANCVDNIPVDLDKERVTEVYNKKSMPKTKAPTRSKRKAKESVGLDYENLIDDKHVIETKKRKKTGKEKEIKTKPKQKQLSSPKIVEENKENENQILSPKILEENDLNVIKKNSHHMSNISMIINNVIGHKPKEKVNVKGGPKRKKNLNN